MYELIMYHHLYFGVKLETLKEMDFEMISDATS